MRTLLDWLSMRVIVLGLGISLAIAATTSTPSYAIPVAGEYLFTSGLTGTFTSTGTGLINWNITDDLGNVWTTSTPSVRLTSNDATLFVVQTTLAPSSALVIRWDPSLFSTRAVRGLPPIRPFTFVKATPVPEPSGFVLVSLGLGLLALVGYMNRQRREAGLQIG